VYTTVTGDGGFFNNPTVIGALVGLIGAFTTLILTMVIWITGKVKTIETHTNGMLTQLQQKVDDANTLRESTKVLTEKNIELERLKREH
jgi:hypothetical protein